MPAMIMFIDTTYMRLGHGPTGAIEMVTHYLQIVKWAIRFALSGEVSKSVRYLSNIEQQDSQHTRRKKEAEGRIKTDQADHQSLRDTLDVFLDPLGYASHPGANFFFPKSSDRVII